MGRVGGEPVHNGLRGGFAGLVAVALTIAKIRVANVGAGGAFGFEVVDDNREARAGGDLFEGLSERRAAFAVVEARVNR